MNIKMLFVSIIAVAFLANPAFAKKPKHGDKHANKHGHNHTHGNSQKYKKKRLPPGLQKKVDRGQALPPGWQKKVARGLRVYRQGKIIIPIDKYGAVSILVDNKIIRVIQATREILDIFNVR